MAIPPVTVSPINFWTNPSWICDDDDNDEDGSGLLMLMVIYGYLWLSMVINGY